MEQESKYYVPKLSDFYIGYEYERAIVIGIGEQFEEDGMFPVSGWEKKVVAVVEQNDTDIVDIPHDTFDKFIRAKYLDKQDIESLAWKHTGGQLLSEGRQEFAIGNYHLIKIMRLKGLTIFYEDNILYCGECKSINELRKIMEWINIK